jgi:hypothetical protein
MEWIVSAVAAAASLLQKERDRGRVVVEGASGWPAAYPNRITGPPIGWVQVTNRTAQPIYVTGLGFSMGRHDIPLSNVNRPMAAYLQPGEFVTGFCDLLWLAKATNIGVDGAYSHVAGMPTVRVKVRDRRLFAPLVHDMAA